MTTEISINIKTPDSQFVVRRSTTPDRVCTIATAINGPQDFREVVSAMAGEVMRLHEKGEVQVVLVAYPLRNVQNRVPESFKQSMREVQQGKIEDCEL